MISIIELDSGKIQQNMLMDFHHQQIIKRKWIMDNDWKLVGCSDLREWSIEKRIWITHYLQQQVKRGGTVLGAFEKEVLVGFCCIDGYLLGKTAQYANLTMLFIDDEWKRQGIGKLLFENICKCAVKMKADKLFISAIPSFETIAFYFNMGCVDAKEIIQEYVDTENDRYLEFSFT